MAKMNLPNRLTLLRLFSVPVMVVFLLLPATGIPPVWAYGVGLVLFIATSLTDMLDGKIARARNLITNFGKFMDPVADKFMVIGTFLAMLFRMMNPAVYGVSYQSLFVVIYFVSVLLVIFREMAITSLRLVLVNTSGQVVAAKMLGKIKTVCQMVSICILFIEPLVDSLLCHLDPTFFFAHVFPLSYFFIALMLVFTILSGFDYIKGGWKHISTDW